MNEAVEKIRKDFGEGDAKRDAGQKTPEDILRYDDILYGTIDSTWQKLDVYRPKNTTKKLPVIMSVHGGGWVYGDKEVYQWYCMSLAQRGFAVVNYSYRLAPEYRYPASLEDTSTVAQWIMNQQDKYGFDTKHIFAVGDSAGAHMLTLFATAITNKKADVSFHVPENFTLQAIALNCGVYNLNESTRKDMGAIIQSFLPEKASEKMMQEISPIRSINDQFPPCFIMTCPGDFLNAAPDELVPALKKYGVPFIYRTYGSAKNPLMHVFHCAIRLPEATLCNDEECNFFKEFCK